MTPTRCPACDARLRPDDAWCSQCHTDLRPAPARVAAQPAQAPTTQSPPTQVRSPADAVPEPRRGGRRAAGPPSDGSARQLTAEETEALALEWVQRLAASEAGAGVPALVGRTRTRGGQGVLAVAGGAALVAAFLVTMAVIGLFL